MSKNRSTYPRFEYIAINQSIASSVLFTGTLCTRVYEMIDFTLTINCICHLSVNKKHKLLRSTKEYLFIYNSLDIICTNLV